MDLIELLQRLALNDEDAVRLAIGAAAAPRAGAALDGRTNALVQLAALLSLGAATCSCRVAVEVARTHGATDAELVGVLVAVAPALGGAGVVAAAPRLARAIDHDVEALDAPPR
jgi:alkylhydroperoxidase/carboxymuconolactone decarboxylase family protein YurZ